MAKMGRRPLPEAHTVQVKIRLKPSTYDVACSVSRREREEYVCRMLAQWIEERAEREKSFRGLTLDTPERIM